MTFLLVLFLVHGETVMFPTTRELCFEALEAHRQGAVVYSTDEEGRRWPAENVLCLEPIEEGKEEATT